MKICFIDEAGDLGLLRSPPSPNDQPVLIIGGLFVDVARLANLTQDSLNLKFRFFPRLSYPSSMPLDRIFGLLRRYEIRLVARIWVKGTGAKFGATSVYTSSIQGICTYFEHHLTETNDAGLQLCDIVCSALLFPIACFAYCTGHVNNVHVQSRAGTLRDRYGQQLKALQYRYENLDTGRYDGGLVVSDAIGQQNGSLMFGWHASHGVVDGCA